MCSVFFLPSREVLVEVFDLEAERAVVDGQHQQLEKLQRVAVDQFERTDHGTRRGSAPMLLETVAECGAGIRTDQPVRVG